MLCVYTYSSKQQHFIRNPSSNKALQRYIYFCKRTKNKTSRPAINGRCENIADYDTVWIGFPVWWYTAPTIVNTFVEAHDLSGKVINVFATSGGSGVEGSAVDLKKAYPQYTWGESRLMNQ